MPALLAAFMLTACPDKEQEVVPEEVEPPLAVAEAGQKETEEPPPPAAAKESICDCTCEVEGCKCSPLTWRAGCSCIDEDMNDCSCDCKGEPIVTVDEVTAEAVVKTGPEHKIEEPSNEELAEEVPPPPPPPKDAS